MVVSNHNALILLSSTAAASVLAYSPAKYNYLLTSLSNTMFSLDFFVKLRTDLVISVLCSLICDKILYFSYSK
jgi:hypothetical protein